MATIQRNGCDPKAREILDDDECNDSRDSERARGDWRFPRKFGRQDVTDERRADFDTFMADFEPSDFGPEFAAQVETAVARLNLLENKRLAVSQSSITGAESINYFTDMHASFLDCVSKSVHATSDGPIAVPR
jgi:hypothetical protein